MVWLALMLRRLELIPGVSQIYLGDLQESVCWLFVCRDSEGHPIVRLLDLSFELLSVGLLDGANPISELVLNP